MPSEPSPLTHLRAGLAHLRGIGSSALILQKATEATCQSCGFDRAMVGRVRGDRVVAESVYFRGDPAGAARALERARRRPQRLDRSPQAGDALRAIGVPWESRRHLTAPIMPEDTLVAILQADRLPQHREVDESDHALLWAFAEGLGCAYQRAVLIERMRQQHRYATSLASAIDEVIAELTVGGDA